jgi:MFS family permease
MARSIGSDHTQRAAAVMSATNKRLLLTILLAILTFNFVDRYAVGIVLQDIKRDLQLTDTQLGFLTGIAFAVFYSVMGIPIARWADRGNRVTIISVTTALWSIAVAACGLAGGFLQLLLIRIGVAVGEAGCIPPAHSLIADTFDRAERPRAVAVYMLGAPLAMVIGYFVAGWLNEFYGWRATFVILGLPGVALAVWVRLALKDPRYSRTSSPAARVGSASAVDTTSPSAADVSPANPAAAVASDASVSSPMRSESAPPALKEIAATLWSNATFRQLLFCFSLLNFFGYGIFQWQPAFLMRSHGLDSGQLGTGLALSAGLCGILGTFAGGELASRFAAHNESLQLRAMVVGSCAFGILFAGVYLVPNALLAFGLIGLASAGGAAINGPLFATIQSVVPPHLRATSIALIYLFANLIGMGLGPLAAGVLSDAFRPWAGEESLRYALLALCPGYFWAAWHLWRASRTVPQDVLDS